MPQITVSTNYTIDGTYDTIFVDASAGDIDITTPAGHIAGTDQYVIKDKLGFAATNQIRILGPDLIDEQADYILSTDRQAIRIVSDGSNWQIF